MADSYEINLEIQGGEQPALVMETEGGATDGASARNAEAWANGTRNGVPVTEGDPAYHNNSKYYRDSAAAIVAGDIIDDDAGIGDYDLTWSADKLVGEFEGKATAIGVTDTESAAVKTFSDGADGMPMGVTIGIEPVQDLHGYDNPWPAGGGKNLINVADATITSQTTVGTVDLPAGVYTASADVKNNATIQGHFRIVVSGTVVASFNINSGDNTRRSVTFTLSEDSTVSIVCNGNSSGYNFTISKVMIESSSTATDFAPYSNVCPISGWTGAEVTRTGKNLFNKNASGINPGHAININTGNEYNTANYSVSEFIKVTPGSSYVTSGNGGSCGACFYNSAKRRIAGIANLNNGAIAPENAVWIKIDYKTANADTVQLESNTTATAYEEFHGNTYEIAFPESAGTVYGGTLTVNADGTGTLVVDKAKCTYGSEVVSGEVVATATGCRADIPCVTTDINYLKWSVQSGAKPIFSHYGGNVSKGYSASQYTLFFDKVYTKQEINQMLGGMECVYKLATPQTYTLTAPQVETLKGMNNLWADTGDIKAVDYPADTKLFVEGKISEGMKLIALLLTANHEDGMKASKAYASGDLLTVGNTLYKATTSIANGATLTEGTNVTETTIAQELAALA